MPLVEQALLERPRETRTSVRVSRALVVAGATWTRYCEAFVVTAVVTRGSADLSQYQYWHCGPDATPVGDSRCESAAISAAVGGRRLGTGARRVRDRVERTRRRARRTVVAVRARHRRRCRLGGDRPADHGPAPRSPDRLAAVGQRLAARQFRGGAGLRSIRGPGGSGRPPRCGVGGALGSVGLAAAVRSDPGDRPALPRRPPSLTPGAVGRDRRRSRGRRLPLLSFFDPRALRSAVRERRPAAARACPRP